MDQQAILERGVNSVGICANIDRPTLSESRGPQILPDKPSNSPPHPSEHAITNQWTTIYREIKQWLERNAPQMAAPSEGAIALLQFPQIPGRVNFISHAVRDLIQNLPNALDGSQQTMRHAGESYPSKINAIKESWPNEQSRLVEGDSVLIPYSAAEPVDDLLNCFNNVTSQATSASKLAAVLVNASEVPLDVTRQLIDTFHRERRWFVDLAHFNAHPKKVVSESELKQHFDAVCRAVHSVIGSYYVGIEELDEVLEANDLKDFPLVLSRIGSQHHARYLFERLSSPDWIEPLNKAGIFDDVPTPELVEDGIRHPPCPALTYLERMAATNPDSVTDIFLKLEFANINAILNHLATKSLRSYLWTHFVSLR